MKYKEFTNIIKKPYFTREELRIHKISVSGIQLSRWKNSGDIEKVQQGIYLFPNRKNELQAEELSFLLYQPSYLSIEYALSHYGFIPEAVAASTAITTRLTRTIVNQLGTFIYRTIVPRLFFGYEAHITKHGKYLLAHPEKALLDYFYLHTRTMRTKEDVEAMRFDYEMMSETLNRRRLKTYLHQFVSKRLDFLVHTLLSLCSHSRN